MNTFLALADKHPAVGITLAVVALGFGVIGYKLVALVLDFFLALLGRSRTVRHVREAKVTTATEAKPEPKRPTVAEVSPKRETVESALQSLGFHKKEYVPVLGELDYDADVPQIIAAALRKLPNKRANVS